MPAIIPNPVINSPFDEPTRYFYFSEDGITDKIVESRRLSSYFIPVPQPRERNSCPPSVHRTLQN